MMRIFLNITGVLLLLLVVSTAFAHTPVIQADGLTHTILADKEMTESFRGSTKRQRQQMIQKALRLPMRSRSIKPLTTRLQHCAGPLSTPVHFKQLSHPLFIVGDDPVSLAWLAHYRAVLSKAQAIGLVIAATSPTDLKALKTAAGDLALFPANGEGVATVFGVSCYPVLINRHRIEN